MNLTKSWLCLLVVADDLIFFTRSIVTVSDEPEDPWRSAFDDLYDWINGPGVSQIIAFLSTSLISTGTYLAVNQIWSSGYICFSQLDSRSAALFMQLCGLFLDSTIILLSWRVLIWAKSTSSRLHALTHILWLSSGSFAAFWAFVGVVSGTWQLRPDLGLSYSVDIFADSIAFAVLIVSASEWICDATPATAITNATVACGLWTATFHVFQLGDWMHLSRSASLLPLWLLAIGTGILLYIRDVRHFMTIHRILFIGLLAVLLLTATIFTFVRPLSHFNNRHPINDLIYHARGVHDSWKVKATTSKSLSAALKTYQGRHDGRDAPPNFSHWYEFATSSEIIDNFHQIDNDLEIFWSISPRNLRKRAEAAANTAGIVPLFIKNGQVHVTEPGDGVKNTDIRELADMIGKFSRHLPDMVLPINLDASPRVIPSWRDASFLNRDYLRSMAKLITKRSDSHTDVEVPTDSDIDEEIGQGETWSQITSSDFRRIQIDACPSGSLVKTDAHWNYAQFCSHCCETHSKGQFLRDMTNALDICAQPDLKYLHGFFLTDPAQRPVRNLVPIFSPSKSDNFRDIMIPLPRARLDRKDMGRPFENLQDSILWRGALGNHAMSRDAIRGSHIPRLLHLVNSTKNTAPVAMVLPVTAENNKFITDKMSAATLNKALPFDVGIYDYSACLGDNCDLIKTVYGQVNKTTEVPQYRYVLLTDDNDGPAQDTLGIVRSGSVPFISTIFRTWYTERLTPWLHFVPIDPRYQALHATLAYFTGVQGKASQSGRAKDLKGRTSDAEWIAQQGQRWAEKALKTQDMEIYLFRLLLEWARLIDDQRDRIGYRHLANGEAQNDQWTIS